MKKIYRIGIVLLVAAAILIIFYPRKTKHETFTPGVDSSQVYQAKKDSAYKVYLDSDSVRRTPISDSERAIYRERLIRAIFAGQRDTVRANQAGSQ